MIDDPTDSSDSLTPSAGEAWQATPRRILFSAFRVAVVGAVLLAVVESQFIALKSGARDVGLYLRVAATGAFIATHLVLWVPMQMLLSVPLSLLVHRGGWMQRLGPAEVIPAALMIAAAGVFVVPGDLMLGQMLTPVRYGGCVGIAGLAALGTTLALRRLLSRPPLYRRFSSLLSATTVMACLLACVSVATMLRSPFAGPEAFRLPRTSNIGPQIAANRPNILLVVMDTVRADRLSCYGYSKDTTPELRRFATEATVFERAVPNGIWTFPSHGSLFTGLPVRTHGADHNHLRLDDRFETLAELLSRSGYQTACLSSNIFVSPEFNMTQGFELDLRTHAVRRLVKSFAVAWGESLGIAPLLPWLDLDAGAALNNYLFAHWLDRDRDATRPFFAYLNYMEAHLPYPAPRGARRRFLEKAYVDRTYQLRHRAYGNIVNLLTAHYNTAGSDCISAEDQMILAQNYDACLYYLDSRLGELLGALEDRGLSGQTIVIFVADHGEALGEHAQWAHESGVFDTLVHVPMLIRDGRRPAARRVTAPVLVSDLFASILRWAGATPEAPAERQPPDLLGNPPPERSVVTEQTVPNERRLRWALHRNPQFDRERFMRKLWAVVGGRFKYIRASDGQDELYDLEADPSELHNLIDALPGEAERLAAHLDVWKELTPQFTPSGPNATPEPDAAVMDVLRGLGYAQ